MKKRLVAGVALAVVVAFALCACTGQAKTFGSMVPDPTLQDILEAIVQAAFFGITIIIVVIGDLAGIHYQAYQTGKGLVYDLTFLIVFVIVYGLPFLAVWPRSRKVIFRRRVRTR